MTDAMRYYKLIGRLPVPVRDFDEWVMWRIQNPELHVNSTQVGPVLVSTIFLGLDHNHREDGDPLLFETMAFNDSQVMGCGRCTTWDEAEQQHAAAVEWAKELVAKTAETLESRE